MSCTCIGLVSWIQIWHPFSFNHYASSTWYIITRTVHPDLVPCSFYAIPISPPFIFYSFGLDGISNVTCATFVRPSAILCCFCRSTSLCLIHEKGTSSTCCPIYMCFPLMHFKSAVYIPTSFSPAVLCCGTCGRTLWDGSQDYRQ